MQQPHEKFPYFFASAPGTSREAHHPICSGSGFTGPVPGEGKMIGKFAVSMALALAVTGAVAKEQKLNDAQIAHIAYTAGNIDINAAKLALAKSHDMTVRG